MFEQAVRALWTCRFSRSTIFSVSSGAHSGATIYVRHFSARAMTGPTTSQNAASADKIKAVFRQYGKTRISHEQLVRLFGIVDNSITSTQVSLLAEQCRRDQTGNLFVDDFIDGICGSGRHDALAVQSLRERLLILGQTFSVEVAPADVCPGDTKRKNPTLLELQTQSVPPLQQNHVVFVNMVKPNLEHFQDVAAASKALAAAGLTAIPHVPAARFANTAEFQAELSRLSDAGARRLLVLGGNDLDEQMACAYPKGAGSLLAAELDAFKAKGVTEVALAGHPDGHPALEGNHAETLDVLLQKARPLLLAGLDVSIVTQFCFDARKLVKWLKSTRTAMQKLEAECRDEVSASETTGRPGRVTFRIGLAGPTLRKRLDRIAAICDVPSFFVSSSFDVFDTDGDGLLSLEELSAGASALGLSKRGSQLHALYMTHVGADEGLGHDQFARLLVEDAMLDSRPATSNGQTRTAQGPSSFVEGTSDNVKDDKNRQTCTAQGPSSFVEGTLSSSATGGPSVTSETLKAKPSKDSEPVWPEEVVLAIASYCERAQVAHDEIKLHFFPFGGLSKTFELTAALQNGSWPTLTEGDLPISPRSPMAPNAGRRNQKEA